MISYSVIKVLHIATVLLSISLFVYRIRLTLLDRPHNVGFLRVLPHLNDTLLLSFAMAMLWIGRINLPDHPWLLAKVGALFVYILLGILAMRAPSSNQRLQRLAAAVVVFAYIVGVALTKSPLVFS